VEVEPPWEVKKENRRRNKKKKPVVEVEPPWVGKVVSWSLFSGRLNLHGKIKEKPPREIPRGGFGSSEPKLATTP